jgi:hypothetical protein
MCTGHTMCFIFLSRNFFRTDIQQVTLKIVAEMHVDPHVVTIIYYPILTKIMC